MNTQFFQSDIGARGKEIARLTKAGFPVPGGFIIRSETFAQILAHDQLQPTIEKILKKTNFTNLKEVQTASATIHKLLMHAEIPHDISQQILEMYVKIGQGKVMIFPSFTDSANSPQFLATNAHSFGYSGEANVFVGIRQLWASFYHSSLLAKRTHHHGDHFSLPFSICVQQQPKTLVSGVLFTTDPTANRKSSMLVKAVWGEGGFTKNLEGADYYWLDHTNGTETEYIRCDQYDEFVWEHGDELTQKTPASRVSKRKLDESMLKKLAQLGQKLAQELFFPQECVFAYDGKKFWIIATQQLALHMQGTPMAVAGREASNQVLSGVEISPGIVSGVVEVISLRNQPKTIHPHSILVASSLSHIQDEHIKKATGIILEEHHKTQGKTLLIHKHGIACIGSATLATQLLKTGMRIKMNTHTGQISRDIPTEVTPRVQTSPHYRLHVFPEYQLGSQEGRSPHTNILLRSEALIRKIGVHPESHEAAIVLTPKLTDRLYHAVEHCKATECIYVLSDFTSDAYEAFHNGSAYEEQAHGNSAWSVHGTSRFLERPKSFLSELTTLRTLTRKYPHLFLSIALPSTRSASEYIRASKKLADSGLTRSAFLKHTLFLSIPSLIPQLQLCIQHGVDSVVCDCDTLANNLFMIESDSESIHIESQELIQVLSQAVRQILTTCRDAGIPVALRGQTLLEYGILDLVKEYGVEALYIDEKHVESLTTKIRNT